MKVLKLIHCTRWWQGKFMGDTNVRFCKFIIVIRILVFRQAYNKKDLFCHIFCCMQHMKAVKANN